MTVAYELGKVGYDCRVLEARPRPGGRVFTVRRGTVSEEDGPQQPDGRVYFAGDYITSLSSFMQGAFESARTVAAAIHKRALAEAFAR